MGKKGKKAAKGEVRAAAAAAENVR